MDYNTAIPQGIVVGLNEIQHSVFGALSKTAIIIDKVGRLMTVFIGLYKE